MPKNNAVKELNCNFHKIPKGDEKENYREKFLRECDGLELKILKREKNDTLIKACSTSEIYLIRDINDKVDVWRLSEDFNMESAIEFMQKWDKIYPIESNISPCELEYKGFEEKQKAARSLLAEGIKPEYVKNITGLPLEEIQKLKK